MRHAAFAAAVGASIAGCALPPAAAWPDDLPPRDACVRAWEADPENQKLQALDPYLAWIRLFYAGNAFAPGWTATSRSLLQEIPEVERPALASRLDGLGRLLSLEWAKDNRRRRIDSPLLALWGGALRGARARQLVAQTVDRIAEDARALLDGALRPEEVTADRYGDVPLARTS